MQIFFFQVPHISACDFLSAISNLNGWMLTSEKSESTGVMGLGTQWAAMLPLNQHQTTVSR